MATRIVTSAWTHLFTRTDIPQRLVAQQLIGRDDPGGPFDQGWIFSGDSPGNPYRAVEGTGKGAIVLYQVNDWSPATQWHTARYPRLSVAVYADSTRDPSGNPVMRNAEGKVEAIFGAIFDVFHDPANRLQGKLGGQHIASIVIGESLSLMEVPDGDGAVRGTFSFDVVALN